MPIRDSKMLLNDAQDGFAANTNSTYEIDFGVTNPDCGRSGGFGLHIIVTTTYTDLNSGALFWVMHGASSAPATKLVGRFIPVASLVAGKHFFLPFPPTNLRYVRLKTVPVSETSTNGAHTAYLGPDEDGTE